MLELVLHACMPSEWHQHVIRMPSACHQHAISMPSACHQHVISMQACTLVLDLVLEINRDGTALHADCMLIT
jgi:hypothetical protein